MNDAQRDEMLAAVEVVRADRALAELMGQTLTILFPDHQLYRIDEEPAVRFLVHPEPARADLRRLEDAAARLATASPVPHAMFRVVEDLRGERRELLVPVSPDAWAGEPGVVGPFRERAAAEGWQERHVAPPLVGDAFAQGEAWFVDVFSGDEDLVRARG